MRIIIITLALLVLVLNINSQDLSHLNQNYINRDVVKIDTLKKDSWISIDKGQHFIGSFIGTLFISNICSTNLNYNKSTSNKIGISIMFSIGLGKEILDSQKPQNLFSLKDLAANMAGILAAIAILETR